MTKYLLVTTYLIISGAAMAQSTPSTGVLSSDITFDSLDVNKDDTLNQSEAASISGFSFTNADRNGDGEISRSEYTSSTQNPDTGTGETRSENPASGKTDTGSNGANTYQR